MDLDMTQVSLYIRAFNVLQLMVKLMSKKNKKVNHIFSFVFFSIIVLILFCKVSWIFRANDSGSRENIVGFHNEKNIDVVMYGGSNLLRFYQPLEAWHQEGYTSYNYATSAARADLLTEYIKESRLTNDAILYVCDIRTIPLVQGTIIEQSLRNWSDSISVFSPIRIKGISSFLFSRDWKNWDIPSFYIDITKYHSNYEALEDPYQWSYINKKNIDNQNKGFSPNKNHVSFDRPQICNERGDLSKQQERALIELLDYCDQENLQVLFIVCPYIITEHDWNILNTCEDIIRSRGYDFINFNYYYDEIGLDFKTDFGDTNHVNYLGAEKYTSYLIDYISNHYKLPDNRKNLEYEKWNDDYISYISQQEEWKKDITLTIAQHLEAKKIGESLKDIDNYANWYESIQNNNFSIVTIKKGSYKVDTQDKTLQRMLDDWKIDTTESTYIGLWTNGKCRFSSNEEEEYEYDLGVDGGRGKVKCCLSVGEIPQMLIGDTDYYQNVNGIQVLVFDNNDQKVIDNVVIRINEKLEVELIRKNNK